MVRALSIGKQLSFLLARTPICADILPGMHFFDAWRIVPTMQTEPDLDSFEGVLSLAKNGNLERKLMHAPMCSWLKSRHCRPVHKNKTSAQMASKIAQVHGRTSRFLILLLFFSLAEFCLVVVHRQKSAY